MTLRSVSPPSRPRPRARSSPPPRPRPTHVVLQRPRVVPNPKPAPSNPLSPLGAYWPAAALALWLLVFGVYGTRGPSGAWSALAYFLLGMLGAMPFARATRSGSRTRRRSRTRTPASSCSD